VRRAAFALAALVAAAPVARADTSALTSLGGGAKPIAIEADDGIEWQQNNHVYIARGHATATRGDDKVVGDTLYARYRPTGTARPAVGKSGEPQPFAGGSTEIYSLEAVGHVTFTAPSQTLTCDKAVYDVDQAVLVATGRALKIVTPRDTITARDSFDWYDQKGIGVARGDAVAVQGDRRVRADVLTARMEKQADGQSRVSRIDAEGNVLVSAPGQVARGDAGVYNVDRGIVTLTGHVRLTRGENELRGRYAVVDLNTKVSRLLSAPPGEKATGRVAGMIIPPRKPKH
jgi:lipopolysaccharide export system protein LptA